MAYTWTELLDSIKVKGGIPTSQNTYTEARLLSIVNQKLREEILPLVQQVREGFLSYDVDSDINATGIYPIPSRAIGGKLEGAALIRGTERQPLVIYDEDEVRDTEQAPSGVPGFFLKRNNLVLLPKDGAGYETLRLSILLRPGEIVSATSATQIVEIDGTSLVCASVPSTWTTSNTFDLVQQNPPFDSLFIGEVASLVETGTEAVISFSELPTNVAVGDWVSLTGQTPVIQLPLELHGLLALRAANECLKNGPDLSAYEKGAEEAKRLEEKLVTLLSPRVEKQSKKLVNRSGILRRGL